MREGERDGLVSFAHDALVTSECLLHDQERCGKRGKVPLWCFRRSVLCTSCFESCRNKRRRRADPRSSAFLLVYGRVAEDCLM